ncbi:MAG: DUF115 domain-containing protein [Lachnospiraceae bacterium]|nr:DUF115 domain-containing protein [Lachnospiraceae bacterium]
MVESRLLELGKECLMWIEQAIYAFRINHPGDGFRMVKKLSGYLMEWYRLYQQVMAGSEEPGESEELAQALQAVLNAIEEKDGILIADMLELRLRPQLYRIQACLLQAGVLYYDFEVFRHNMTLLNIHMPGLADKLYPKAAKLAESDLKQLWEHECAEYILSGTLEPTSSGYATCAVSGGEKKCYVHSNANPLWEAYLQAFQYYDEENEKYFCFGMGLGYLPQALMDLDCSIDLVVYELNMDSLRMSMLVNSLDWLFGQRNVQLVFDPALERLSEFLSEEAVNIFLPGTIWSVKDEQVRERLELLNMQDTNVRSRKREFIRNFRLNCRSCSRYVDDLQMEFEGKNALIVAAGPSLNKNLHMLKEVPSNTIIVATGTVYKLLLKNGIIPDYVVFSEAREAVYAQVEGLLEQQVPIVVGSTAYYRIAMDYEGPVYLVCQEGYQKAVSYAKKKGWGIYASGGGVATIALSVCVQLGCREVAFIGLDLSYTDERTHAEGTRQDKRIPLSELKPMPGACGGTVYVSKAFQMYREWIENFAADLSGKRCRRIIDATEGGVLKKNLQIMPLAQVFREWEDE